MNEGAQNPGGRPSRDGIRTRPSLLLRVKDFRDQKSWEEFVEIYGPLILRYLRKVGVAEQDAVDLVQDVLGIVLRHIGTFEYDPAKGRFRGWIKTIATHRAFRFLAESRRRPVTPGGSGHLLAMGQAASAEAAQEALIEAEWEQLRLEVAMKRVRSAVQPATWQAFELLSVEGLPPAEIADRLGMQIGAVYKNISRVKARLREAVEEIDE